MSAVVRHIPGREYVPAVPAQEEEFVVTLTLSRRQLQTLVDLAAGMPSGASGIDYETWVSMRNAVGGYTGNCGTYHKAAS